MFMGVWHMPGTSLCRGDTVVCKTKCLSSWNAWTDRNKHMNRQGAPRQGTAKATNTKALYDMELQSVLFYVR